MVAPRFDGAQIIPPIKRATSRPTVVFGWSTYVCPMLKQTVAVSLAALAYLTPSAVPAGPTLTNKPVVQKKTIVEPGLRAICLSFKLTPNEGQAPTLKGGCSFAGAKAVHFGSAAAAFYVQKDGSIVATPPALPAGSSVPVTVRLAGGQIVGGRSQLYSYPLAEMDMEGPYAFPLGEDQASYNWWQGTNSHLLRESQPASLSYITLAPTLYVGAYFSKTIYTESTQAPYVLGNIGLFTAKLQVCTVSSPSGTPGLPNFLPTAAPGDPCTNWDSAPGYWKDVTSASVTVHAPTGTQIASQATIPLSTAAVFSAGTPETMQLARTLRIVYGYRESDDDAQFATRVGLARFDQKNGKPFNAIIAPTALYQMKAIPYTILYQPPGDQSTVTFTAATTYGATYSLGTSTENDTSSTSEQNQTTNFSESYAFGLLTAGFGDKSGWDQTTKRGFGATAGTAGVGTGSSAFSFSWQIPAAPGLTPGSGAVCAATTNCSTQTSAANAYAAEPFWLDTFVLLVHPQYAYWQLGAQNQSYVLYGAVPVTADVTVAELDACARGQTWFGLNPCQVDYSDDDIKAVNGQPISYSGAIRTLLLTASEANHLLALDPFYAQGQNANLLTTRATPISSAGYGASIGAPSRPFVTNLQNTASNQQTGSTNLQYTSSLTTVVSDDPSITGGGKGSGSEPSVSYTTTLSYDDLTKNSTETDLKTTFTNSTAVSNQRVTSANVVLNDLDSTSASCKTCHNPLAHQPSANIYFDRVFGTFMFQDPGAPRSTVFVKPVCCAVLLRGLLAHEAHLRRFSDVPKGDPNAAILGLMARAGLVPVVAPGKFAPQARASATVMTAALGRARSHAASTLAPAALALKPVAAQTREQAAVALFKSLTAAAR